MSGTTIEELEVGTASDLTKTYDEWDVYTFAALTGDLNPAHVDQAFAERTVFRGKIAHGMLTASLISAVLGTKLPGPGSIYLSQDLHFLRPVRIGDTVTARVEVVELVREKNLARLKTTCTNQNGERLLEGTALVMPPKVKLTDAAREDAEPKERPGPRRRMPEQEGLRASRLRKGGFRVGERMTRDPLTISPEASLAEAKTLLDQHRIRNLPVVERGKLVGMITDRDLRRASLPGAPGSAAPETKALLSLIKVGEVMSRDVITVGPEAGIGEAARLLIEHKIGGLPVLEHGRLAGIVTVTDALEALVELMGI